MSNYTEGDQGSHEMRYDGEGNVFYDDCDDSSVVTRMEVPETKLKMLLSESNPKGTSVI